MESEELRKYADFVKSNCKKITMQEEEILIEKAKQGDQHAKEKLVASSMYLVLQDLRVLGLPFSMETVQEANLAMLTVIETTLKGNSQARSLRSKIYMNIRRKVVQMLREKSSVFCLKKKNGSTKSTIESVEVYDIVPYEEESGENDASPWDYAIKPTEEAVIFNFMREALEDQIEKFSEKDQRVLVMRFGLKGRIPMEPRDVAKELGMEREEVRKREAITLHKLRHPSRAMMLADYLD